MSPRRRRILVVLAVAILVVLIGGRLASDLYVDALWYGHLGYGSYFWKLKLARWLTTLAFGVVAGLVVFGNLYPFVRLAPRVHIRRRYGNIEIAEVLPRRQMVLIVLAIGVAIGWVAGLYMGARSTLPILQLLAAPKWRTVEPIFSRDLSFYVFDLPVLVGLQAFLVLVAFVTLVLVVGGYAMAGGLAIVQNRLHVSPWAHRHLGGLAAVVMLAMAAGFWLGMQHLLWAGNGVTGTLGYTDVTARFLARRILIGVSVLVAVAFLVGAIRGTFLYGAVGLGVLVVATVALNYAYPALIQKLRVEPNELERERPYLTANLSFTRSGYGLDAFDERDYPLDLEHTPSDSAITRATAGLPLWDRRPLRATFNQLQGINPYYTFADVDYDRYGGPDHLEQVAVSAREIDIGQLPAEARTWQNLHLSDTYTHGLGIVMSPAARMQPGGSPLYYVSGIPPVVAPDAPPGVELRWPDIYFGEKSSQWVLVEGTQGDAQRPEPIGVRLNSFVRKLSLAWTFGDKNLLLSQQLKPGTRILFNRTVQTRTARLAPFLIFEADVYPVLADGHVVWIQDAYTVTPNYPLSERMDVAGRPIRYIRNSVKVVVDALTGATRFYVTDPSDPIVASLRGAFPSLFRPLDEMPASIRAHLRYPRELLMTQARILRAYHVKDSRALYHQLDLWDLPVERYREGEELVQPYYVVMPDPASDEARPAYMLVYPMTARGRDNMRALLVARADVTARPQVTLYGLPSEQVLGPRQVEVRIDQEPTISQQFTLWQQRGSRVIRGHLLVVPVEGTFIYVEPVFLEAESRGAAPSLERVVLATESAVVMGESIDAAVAALRTGRTEPVATAETPQASPVRSRLDRLRRLVEQADAALRAGDLTEFGRLWGEIRALSVPPPDSVQPSGSGRGR